MTLLIQMNLGFAWGEVVAQVDTDLYATPKLEPALDADPMMFASLNAEPKLEPGLNAKPLLFASLRATLKLEPGIGAVPDERLPR